MVAKERPGRPNKTYEVLQNDGKKLSKGCMTTAESFKLEISALCFRNRVSCELVGF